VDEGECECVKTTASKYARRVGQYNEDYVWCVMQVRDEIRMNEHESSINRVHHKQKSRDTEVFRLSNLVHAASLCHARHPTQSPDSNSVSGTVSIK